MESMSNKQPMIAQCGGGLIKFYIKLFSAALPMLPRFLYTPHLQIKDIYRIKCFSYFLSKT